MGLENILLVLYFPISALQLYGDTLKKSILFNSNMEVNYYE